MIKFLYKTFLKPILFLFNPEFIHNQFTLFGEILGSLSIGRLFISTLYGYRGRDISKTVDGVYYKTPVLLSAGFDYNGNLSQILPFMGFGGEEVGSVTAKKTLGNDSPRLIRLKKNKSIIVNKGLKNDGVDVIIKRLKSKRKFNNFVVGISIALTNNEDAKTLKDAVDDYAYSFKRLNEESVGDYYTLNISCPNACWGENFANPQNLTELLKEITKTPISKPIYLKMPINLQWEEIKKLIDIAISFKINGVIIGNLNKDHSKLKYPEELPKKYKGNLSGDPTKELSTKLIALTRKEYGKQITIIGVGGILSSKDAIEKFEAGADLVQLITGMIFEGPHLISEINEAYAQKYI